MSPKRRPTKEEVEAAFVSRFLDATGFLPGSSPVRPPKDPPDFSVEHRGKRIAIEVTRIFKGDRKGSPLREAEANRDWILRWLEARLTEADFGPALVSVGFARDKLTKSERSQFARTILDLIQANVTDGQPFELHWRAYAERGEYGSVWPEALESIRVRRPPGWDSIEVSSGSAGSVASPQRLLQAAIDDKEADLPNYREGYDESWLLMVAEVMGPSSFIEADPASREHGYRFAFDRAFFLGFGKDSFELRRETP